MGSGFVLGRGLIDRVVYAEIVIMLNALRVRDSVEEAFQSGGVRKRRVQVESIPLNLIMKV
jgi:hypothetical protein